MDGERRHTGRKGSRKMEHERDLAVFSRFHVDNSVRAHTRSYVEKLVLLRHFQMELQ